MAAAVVRPGHADPRSETITTSTESRTRRRRGPRVPPTVRAWLAPTLLGVAVLGAWGAGAAGTPAYLLPTPGAVAAKLLAGLGDGSLWPYVAATTLESVLGCLLGAAVALPLAVTIHRSCWAEAATRPFLGATQAIPAIALAPLLVLWLGYGLVPIVVLCALIVFFPILVAATTGLAHVDHDIVDAARLDGATSWQRLRHVELPLASPVIMAGLRNGFTLSVTGAVVGEMVMGGDGLGAVLTVQRDRLDTAGMFATILVLALLASAAYGALYRVERRSATIAALRRDQEER